MPFLGLVFEDSFCLPLSEAQLTPPCPFIFFSVYPTLHCLNFRNLEVCVFLITLGRCLFSCLPASCPLFLPLQVDIQDSSSSRCPIFVPHSVSAPRSFGYTIQQSFSDLFAFVTCGHFSVSCECHISPRSLASSPGKIPDWWISSQSRILHRTHRVERFCREAWAPFLLTSLSLPVVLHFQIIASLIQLGQSIWWKFLFSRQHLLPVRAFHGKIC